MRTGMTIKAAACALPLLLAGCATTAGVSQKPISRAEKAGDALEIQNIMGRYAIYVVANKWNDIGDLFALDEPDVRQSVPFPMTGAAVRTYFSDRAKEKLAPGVMHQHSFMAPLIEVAGDGQTAKGVWDSVGIDAGSGDSMPSWGWVRYAVDFKLEHDQWKIWHMQVLTIWRAPYGDAWAQMVQQASKGTRTGGGGPAVAAAAPAGGGAPAAGAPPARPTPEGLPASYTAPKWRYTGTDDTPVVPINPPKPYYTFDPKDAY